jgi:PhzF family phenazine biosynthesis protein
MKIDTVDSFIDKPFCGNPAAVHISNSEISDDYCQLIAREINYSETAFVVLMDNLAKIKWFTPKKEVDICGHATLAAARILYEFDYFDKGTQIIFHSKEGELSVNMENDKISMNFPQKHLMKSKSNENIESGFGIKPRFVFKDNNRYLVEIDKSVNIHDIKPKIDVIGEDELGRFIITQKSDGKKYDFVSRYFAPKVGVIEDPVTGLAHCYLAPYWSKRLKKDSSVVDVVSFI